MEGRPRRQSIRLDPDLDDLSRRPVPRLQVIRLGKEASSALSVAQQALKCDSPTSALVALVRDINHVALVPKVLQGIQYLCSLQFLVRVFGPDPPFQCSATGGSNFPT